MHCTDKTRRPRPRRLPAFLPGFIASLALAITVAAGQEKALDQRYEFRAAHDPDGIGKFYRGREIAHVMGHEAADWLDRPERDAEEHTGALVTALGVRPGDVVADIGAGTGYFTRRLARQTGPAGTVLAVDIQPEMLSLLTNRMRAAGLTNVLPVLGTTTDPRLPAGRVDLALLVDVYHEFEFPFEMVEGICRALKPGGRIVFAEFRGENPTVPIKPLHKMTEAQLKKEMAGHPLRWLRTDERLPRQHLIVFQKNTTSSTGNTSSQTDPLQTRANSQTQAPGTASWTTAGGGAPAGQRGSFGGGQGGAPSGGP